MICRSSKQVIHDLLCFSLLALCLCFMFACRFSDLTAGPAQLCRGENTSKVISTAIGQTVKFSICIISQGNPRWLDTSLYEDLSVTFTVMEPNGLYFSVNILLYNVQEHDQGTKVFSIDNGNGLLHYKVTLNIESKNKTLS